MGPVGSVEFMDPALLTGGRASRASDVWSLGATLHRGLTGTGLYGELSDADALLALRKVLSSEPVIASSLDRDAATLISRCLATDAEQRPQSAAEVAAGISALARKDADAS
jgi:serine/threonine protein kinase